MKKNVVILGSTGSIGVNALRVVAALPDRLRVVGLSAHRNYRLLLQQAQRFGVRRLAGDQFGFGLGERRQPQHALRPPPAG